MQPRGPVRSQVSVKTAATVGFTLLGIAALAALVVKARTSLSILVAALLVAVAMHHGVDFLTRHGLRRRPAIAAVFTTVFVLVVGLFLLVIPPAVRQGTELLRRGPELVEQARSSSLYQKAAARFPVDDKLRQAREQAQSAPGKLMDPALHAVRRLAEALGALAAVLGTAMMMVVFGPSLVRRALAEALPERRERYGRVLRRTYKSVGGYLTGLALLCASEGAATAVFLAVLRIPFFLPLGLLAATAAFIPIVGAMLAGVLITAIAFIAGGVSKGIACAVFFILLQQVENHLLGPLIYRRTVDINPAINVVALLVLSNLLGILGAIIAVPAVATGQVVVRELLLYRREQLAVPAEGPVSEPGDGEPPPAGRREDAHARAH